MNVPKLRFGEFEGDWDIATFGDIATKQSRKYNPEIEKNDLPCIELEHIEQGTGSLLGSVNARGQKSIKNCFNQGNVLFGKLRPYLKKYAQPNFDGVCSSEIWVFKGKTVNDDFLYRLIQTDYFMGAVNSTSGSKMPRAEWDLLKNLNFGYPKNTNEQQKIADFLSAVDEKITALTAQKTALTQYKQGMMQRIFTQTLRFKDDNGVEYPEWDIKTLGELAKKSTSKNKDESVKTVFTNSAVQGIVNQLDFFDKDIANQNNLANYYIVEKNDFVYNPRISKFAPVGPIKRNHLGTGVMSPLYTVFRFNEGNLGFMSYLFDTAIWHDYMFSIANFGVRFDRMNISQADFFEMPIAYPCIEEQTKIAQFLTELDDKINAVDAQIQSAQQWKQGLLQQMFV